jgi:hypothetical protein
MKLSERFTALDDNLKLVPGERKSAEEVHNHIGELLVAAGIAKRTRLQGSFARKTMLPPLHDVDKVIELVDALRAELEGSPIGAKRAMEMISQVIAPHYPNAGFETKKHALGISLPDEGFDFDAVPAFNPEDGSGWIAIADTAAMGWKPSNTYQLIDVISKRNIACGGRFVHQVRMVKQAVSNAGLSDSLPGLHTETFCFFAITEILDHPTAVALALAKAVELLGTSYTDPTGADEISRRLEYHHVVTAQRLLAPLSAKATEAIGRANTDDERGAVLLWAEIFGDLFPSPADEERSALSRLTAAPAALGLRPSTPPTRAWRPA